ALSRQAALPVILGASALTGLRMARGGSARGAGRALLAGGISAFISTLASARLLGRGSHDERSLLPYALYRCAVAALVLRRLRGGTGAGALCAQ
ncbi:MAG: hypothetical protein M3Z95_07035, partial [Actinomycetota bacterium]|nr:hypothetical protein [Actinomycetota bacterium]